MDFQIDGLSASRAAMPSSTIRLSARGATLTRILASGTPSARSHLTAATASLIGLVSVRTAGKSQRSMPTTRAQVFAASFMAQSRRSLPLGLDQPEDFILVPIGAVRVRERHVRRDHTILDAFLPGECDLGAEREEVV